VAAPYPKGPAPSYTTGWDTILLDLWEHSDACHDTRLVAGEPPLQATWKQLIRLVLGYEGKASGNEDVRAYQRDRLGRRDGQTLLVEVSSVNASSLSVPVLEREAHRAERIATIRRRILEHEPEFVVFYGRRYANAYAEIAGDSFDADGYRWAGPTLCALVRHPVSRPTLPGSCSKCASSRRIVRRERGPRPR